MPCVLVPQDLRCDTKQRCAENWAGCFICAWRQCWGPWRIPPGQEAAGSQFPQPPPASWESPGQCSAREVSGEQRGHFTPTKALLPDRLFNKPGSGRGMEGETGTPMGCTPLGGAVSDKGVSGTAGSLEDVGWTRRRHVLRSSSAGPAPKGSEDPETLCGSVVGYNLPTRQLTSPSKKLLLTLPLCPAALQGPLELPGHLRHESVAGGEAAGDGGLGRGRAPLGGVSALRGPSCGHHDLRPGSQQVRHAGSPGRGGWL